MISEQSLLIPEWPAPANVRALCTTRLGGVSPAPWASLNLGSHVGDDVAAVRENRERLARYCGVAGQRFGWLDQVHGNSVVELPVSGVPPADASFTTVPDTVCAILTADCLPVLFCDRVGTRVAAAHAGWRGLCDGVLERTAKSLGHPSGLMAWLGPAIGPACFEVGPEVRQAFVGCDPQAATAFTPTGARPGHFMADIYMLARQRLSGIGLAEIYGGGLCTVSDPARFFSYRRDGQTGRMASIIWLT